ncbi:MAG: hypothetical protein ACYDA3_05405 [Gaiellaceae bacterium]
MSLAAAAAFAGLLVLPEGAALDAGTVNSSANENYKLQVGANVQGVTAGEALSGTHNWNVNTNNSGMSSLTGVQLRFDAVGSGADYTNSSVFGFNYKFFPNDMNAFVQSHSCPAPTATEEVCPSPAVTLPPGSGEITVFTGPGKPTTVTPGFDASRTLTAIPSSTDSAASVAVTLRDSRYAAAGGTLIAVRSSNDNADVNSMPTVTANGQPLPNCPQPGGSACVVPADFGAYQYTAPGGNKTTCESVSMSIQGAQIGSEYVFGWQENESGPGCPAGQPGASVLAWTPVQTLATVPCDAGTDCSATQSVPDVGTVTTTVAPGQGVTGFSRNQVAIYAVGFGGTAAPPAPAGTLSSHFAYSTTPDGTASATNEGTTASGTGVGALTVSQWGSDPVTSPPFNAAGKFFDIQVLSGSKFPTVTVHNCNIASGDSLTWWNGTAWLAVVPQSYDPGPPGCASAVLSDSSKPSLSQLGGTIFGVVNAPLVSVTAKKLVLSGTRVRLPLGCARLACRGTAALEQPAKGKTKLHAKPFVLGQAKYAIAVGKKATVVVTLNHTGKKLLAHVSRAHPFKAEAAVSVQHGSTLVMPVLIAR